MKHKVDEAVEKLNLIDTIPFTHRLVAPQLSKPGVEIQLPQGKDHNILRLLYPWLTPELLETIGFIVFRGYRPSELRLPDGLGTDPREQKEEVLYELGYPKQSQYFHKDVFGRSNRLCAYGSPIISLRYDGDQTRVNQTGVGDKSTVLDAISEIFMHDPELSEKAFDLPLLQRMRRTLRIATNDVLFSAADKNFYIDGIVLGSLKQNPDIKDYLHTVLANTGKVAHITYEPDTLVLIHNDGMMHALFVPQGVTHPLNDALKRRVLYFNKRGQVRNGDDILDDLQRDKLPFVLR